MKIGVISLGCAKNQVDTERMLGLLAPAGYAFTEDPAQAEVLIVNTCGFLDSAKAESLEASVPRRFSPVLCRATCSAGVSSNW